MTAPRPPCSQSYDFNASTIIMSEPGRRGHIGPPPPSAYYDAVPQPLAAGSNDLTPPIAPPATPRPQAPSGLNYAQQIQQFQALRRRLKADYLDLYVSLLQDPTVSIIVGEVRNGAQPCQHRLPHGFLLDRRGLLAIVDATGAQGIDYIRRCDERRFSPYSPYMKGYQGGHGARAEIDAHLQNVCREIMSKYMAGSELPPL